MVSDDAAAINRLLEDVLAQPSESPKPGPWDHARAAEAEAVEAVDEDAVHTPHACANVVELLTIAQKFVAGAGNTPPDIGYVLLVDKTTGEFISLSTRMGKREALLTLLDALKGEILT